VNETQQMESAFIAELGTAQQPRRALPSTLCHGIQSRQANLLATPWSNRFVVGVLQLRTSLRSKIP